MNTLLTCHPDSKAQIDKFPDDSWLHLVCSETGQQNPGPPPPAPLLSVSYYGDPLALY